MVSFENDNMMKRYKEIRKELEKYDKKLKLGKDGLANKKEIVILSKSDVANDAKTILKKAKEFQKIRKDVFTLTLFDDASMKKLGDSLAKILGEL